MVSMRHERYSTFSDPPVRSRNCSSARIVMMKLLLQPTWRWAVWPPILLFYTKSSLIGSIGYICMYITHIVFLQTLMYYCTAISTYENIWHVIYVYFHVS